jgi:hypothetical protein
MKGLIDKLLTRTVKNESLSISASAKISLVGGKNLFEGWSINIFVNVHRVLRLFTPRFDQTP